MLEVNLGSTPGATPNTAIMRCFRIVTIRCYRLRCALLFSLAFIVLILIFKTNIFVQKADTRTLKKQPPYEADEEIAVEPKTGRYEHVDLSGHFQPPPGDWRKWEESRNSGVRIQTWKAKKTKMAEGEIVVKAQPGEQLLLDDVMPEAFAPVVLPSTTTTDSPMGRAAPTGHFKGYIGKILQSNEVPRQNEEGDEVMVKFKEKLGKYELELNQGIKSRSQIGYDFGKKSDLTRKSNRGDINAANTEWDDTIQVQTDNNGYKGSQSEVIKKVDAVILGRGDHGGEEQFNFLGLQPKSKKVDQKLELINEQDTLQANHAKDLLNNDDVLVLDRDDVKAMHRMHTPPPWMYTLKPLKYKDYATNCTQGSLPVPGSSFHTKKFCLVEDHHKHFGIVANRLCYYKGTDVQKTRRLKTELYCHCQIGWHGKFCSMHDIVFKGGYPYEYGVGIQKPPRRIIYAFPFNAEFDMLEIILNSLSEAVDVFLILESNYTAAGQPKERVLLHRLQNGYFREFQHKIVYISLDYFPRVAYTDGWAADALLRNHIGETAFGGVLENVRDDDIIVSLDTDEVIHPEALMFLKLHYGYPEPFGFTLRHTVYGYFWRAPDKVTNSYGGCRVAMFRELLKSHLYDIRNAPKNIGRDVNELQKFKRHHGTRIKPWLFGSHDLPAGWHCSWCFSPLGIRYKLISAHASDFPRWGTFPDKTNLVFITKLVRQGLWFDEKTYLKSRLPGEENYAPPYVEAHSDHFSNLREHEAYLKNNQIIDAQELKVRNSVAL